MRKIEFRAWDTLTKRYLYNIQAVTLTDESDDYHGLLTLADFLNNDRYIVEQFTGLFDKTGEKIFENDIVTPADKPHLFGTVLYDDATGSYAVKYPHHDQKDAISNYANKHRIKFKLKIWGTIHTQQALLGK